MAIVGDHLEYGESKNVVIFTSHTDDDVTHVCVCLFQEIISRVEKSKNVVISTNIDNLYNELDSLQQGLVICEKALAEYLETKRLAFPRFYFVSSADLLDILSNGNNPVMVAKHLTKLFDSMANLRFNNDSAGEVTKIANAMYSKDGEMVPFPGDCDCSGQVRA